MIESEGGRNETLTSTESSDDSSSSDGGVYYRNNVLELSLEVGVEVDGSSDGGKAVAVGELGEDSD